MPLSGQTGIYSRSVCVHFSGQELYDVGNLCGLNRRCVAITEVHIRCGLSKRWSSMEGVS